MQREAPIRVEIRKYIRDASAFVQTFPAEPMWPVQVMHEANPSVTYDIVRCFNDFLAVQHAENHRVPGSPAVLDSSCHSKLVLTDGNDQDRKKLCISERRTVRDGFKHGLFGLDVLFTCGAEMWESLQPDTTKLWKLEGD